MQELASEIIASHSVSRRTRPGHRPLRDRKARPPREPESHSKDVEPLSLLVYSGGPGRGTTSACTSAAIAPHSGDVGVCIICLDSDPPPIQSGCACRSDGGLAHARFIAKAVSQQPHRGNEVWWECQTCGQDFTGVIRTGLGEAWWSRVCDEAEESDERLAAAGNLAGCREGQGKHVEAERILRDVLGVERRVLGDEHLHTLNIGRAHKVRTPRPKQRVAAAPSGSPDAPMCPK